MRFPLLLSGLILLGACGSEADTNRVELPEPSGPPVVQQVEEEPAPAVPAPAAASELRVMQDGALLMRLGCDDGQLTLHVPGFRAIGSEDRLTLGLGDEAVTMAADLQEPGGVTGSVAVPPNLAELVAHARTVSVVYGNQQAGPVPAPPAAEWQALLRACRS